MRGLLSILLLVPSIGIADPLILQSTTSTQNSGLYDAILPEFTQETGIEVSAVAVGTGQAIRNARNCDADLLLVHDTNAENAFVDDGFGERRDDLMFNDFIIVGPATDPAEIAGLPPTEALSKIAEAQARFMSRGDDSGTHKAELRLWADVEFDPQPFSGDWYLETGSGMGSTLNTAFGLDAYAFTDRATWLRFANKGSFEILVENNPALVNQYGIVTIASSHCADIDHEGAQILRDWLIGDAGQSAIAEFEIDGAQVFFPNASP